MSTSSIHLWLALRHVPKLGPVTIHQLLADHQSVENIWNDLPLSQADRAKLLGLAKQEKELCDQQNIIILTIDQNKYPSKIKPYKDIPPVLYLQGYLPPSDHLTIAVVGSRAASPYGKDVTETIVRQLVTQQCVIISGLAKGIDGLAHRAALTANSQTIAVLGSGLDQIYPAEHTVLAADIAQHGALLSQFPPGTAANTYTFPARNRLMAALSDAVLVTEARENSGSLLTTQAARDYGKPVFAIPGSIFHPNSFGTNKLIQTGAHLVLTAADIVETLGQTKPQPAAPSPDIAHSAQEVSVLQLLQAGPRHIDELIRHSGLTAAQTMSVVAQLELSGTIKPTGVGEYRIA